MVHFVKVQAGITDPSNLYKRTEKKDGVKTTYLFARDGASQPKTIKEKILQKFSDLKNGVKKASDSVTLLKGLSDLQSHGLLDAKGSLVQPGNKLNTNLLTNIAQQLSKNNTDGTLNELQGNRFNFSLHNESS